MTRSLCKRAAVVAGTVAALTLALAGPAAAHVTVNPKTATQGGYAKVTFRVPNETDNADTTELEINLPIDTPVASVSLKPISGWTAVTDKSKLATPIKAHDTEITEAVSKITWTALPGAAVKPGQFQEFDVSLGPLPHADRMIFKALQTYSDGNVVRWIDEPTTDGTEPEHPAPVLTLTPAAVEGAAAATAGPSVAAADTKGDGNGTPYGIAGIVLGLAGLVLGLLAYRRSSRSAPAAPAASTAAEPDSVPAGTAG
jgi:periplasmic copper chaperone A